MNTDLILKGFLQDDAASRSVTICHVFSGDMKQKGLLVSCSVKTKTHCHADTQRLEVQSPHCVYDLITHEQASKEQSVQHCAILELYYLGLICILHADLIRTKSAEFVFEATKKEASETDLTYSLLFLTFKFPAASN